MKSFTAHYIYLGGGVLLKKQLVCFDEKGFLVAIKPLKDEVASTEFHNGLLCAAFGLKSSNVALTVGEASQLISSHGMSVVDFFLQKTNDAHFTTGQPSTLWCLDGLDLIGLKTLEKTRIYTVFP